MKTVFYFFIDNYKLSIVLTLFIIIYGLMGIVTINREAIPPVNFALAIITTEYPGSSPEEVEQNITIKIEDEIRTVDGVKDVKSVSQSGRSIITVRMEVDDIDIDKAMSDLQRAVQRVKGLPDDIREDPLLEEIKSDELPVVELAITGTQNNRERDEWADRIKTILEDIPGVSSVDLDGFREREYQILLNPKAMEKNFIGNADVARAVRNHSLNVPAGFVENNRTQKLVRIQGQVKSLNDVRNIVVRSNILYNVTIKDIARVKDGAEDARIIARANGVPATTITVVKKSTADAVKTSRQVEKRIEEIRKQLPEEFSIIIFNDEAIRISDRLNVVTKNALTGLALVLLILLFFLPGKIGFVAALSLPLAILGTLGTMAANDINFNVITMLAIVIVIGMLVDNSVVVSENYARLRQEGVPLKEAALRAVHQFWFPITATVLTTVAAFLPMLVTKGIMGQFIRYIPIVVTFALIIGLVEAFFILPSRLQWTLTKDVTQKKRSRFHFSFSGLQKNFTRFMGWAIKRRYVVLLIITGIFISSMVINVVGNRFELFPNEAVELYIARYELNESATLKMTDRAGSVLESKIREKMGKSVKSIIQKSGIAQIEDDDPQRKDGDNVGMLLVFVPLEKARTLDSNQVLRNLRSISMKRFKKLEFGNIVRGPPVGKAVNLTLRSTEYKPLRKLATKVLKDMKNIKGLKNLNDDEVKGIAEYKVDLNYAKLAKAQLSVVTVGQSLRTALQGYIAAELNIEGNEFNLVIRNKEDYRRSGRSLLSMEILNDRGRLVPLKNVARLKEITGPSVIKHFDYLRSITISSDVDPEIITAVTANARTRKIIEQYTNDYPSVSFKFGGEEESTQESLLSLFMAMVLALFSIFAILIFMFRSFTKPYMILSSIPLGLVGVSWSFFLHGKPLSFLALIGVVGLAGIIVNSAIVLMSYIDQLLGENKMDFYEVLAAASGHRFRAVLVTSLTTIGGLLPTAYGIGGYDPTLVPMTFALAWGLISGTLLTIIWVPCGLAIIEDLNRWFKRMIKKVPS